MVFRDHVRIVCIILIVDFQVLDSDMSWMNLEFWMKAGRLLSPGTWNLKVVDLKR